MVTTALTMLIIGAAGLAAIYFGSAWIRAAWDGLWAMVTTIAGRFGGSIVAYIISIFVVGVFVVILLVGGWMLITNLPWPNTRDLQRLPGVVAYTVEDTVARNPGWGVEPAPINEKPAGWDLDRAATIKAMPGHLNGDSNPASVEGFWRRCKDGSRNCWEWLAGYVQNGTQQYLGGLFTPQIPALGVRCGKDPSKVQPEELLPGVEYCLHYLRTALVPAPAR